MTKEQLKEFGKLETLSSRAKYLLGIGVSAKTDIVDLDLVYRARVGDISLPVTCETELEAIAAGEEYLRVRL